MSLILRTWLAFAALGVGLIHLALVVSAPLPVALVAALIGFTELAWAVLVLRQQRIFAPRAGMFAALLPIALWLALLVSAPPFANNASLSHGALAAGAALELFVAAALALHLRRGRALPIERRAPPPWLYLSGLMAGALAVGAIVTPALASTAAGRYAQPHGEHTLQVELPHDDDHR